MLCSAGLGDADREAAADGAAAGGATRYGRWQMMIKKRKREPRSNACIQISHSI